MCWKREQSEDDYNVKTKASEVYQMAIQILFLNLRFCKEINKGHNLKNSDL